MADAVEEALNEIQNRLYDNMIGGDFKNYINSISLSTKERMVKDNLLGQTREFFNRLNSEFKDVRFIYQWSAGRLYLNSEMQKVYSDVYNKDFAEDSHDFEGMYDQDSGLEHFYHTPLGDITIKIDYFWERVCSIGCKHRTKRYYLVNVPKLLDWIGYLKIGMPVRTFVKEYIPDFFYDPMKQPAKRGRPRKQ